MGDEARVRELLAAHGPALHGYVVRRAGPGTDPADVVASVFEVVWRGLGRVPAGAAARPYLFGVARNVLANAERGRRRQLRLAERVAAHTPAQVQPAVGDESPEVERVREAVARLAPLDREALLLVLWDGLSHAEAAQALGCSTRAVTVRLSRARQRVRALLDGAATARSDARSDP